MSETATPETPTDTPETPDTPETSNTSNTAIASTDEAKTDESKKEQTVSIEEIGPARKKITIQIPAKRIASTLEDNYDKLMTDTVLPGFRKGRAPRRLVEKRFGTAMKDDAKGQLISESYTQAIEEKELEVLGEPDIKDIENIKLPEKGDLTVEVEVEVAPAVKIPDLKNIELHKEDVAVADADVKQEITQLCEQYGPIETVEDGKVIEKDFLLCDVHIVAGEKSEGQDEQEEIAHHPATYAMVHGKDKDYKGHIAGILIDDFGKTMLGKKRGDSVDIAMQGPPSHEDQQIKDKAIIIKIKIEKVERSTPLAEDKLAEQLGVEDLDTLKKQLKESLLQRKQAQHRSKMHEQVTKLLLEKVDLELPAGLTGRQTERILHRKRMELVYQGIPEQEIEQRVAELRTESAESASKDLKQFFILSQAAKDFDIQVSEAEVNNQIAQMAMQKGRRPEKLKQEMLRSGELEYIYLQIREQKTLDLMIEKAKVTEKVAPAGKKKDASKDSDKGKAEEKAEAKTTKKKTTKKKKPTKKKDDA